MEYVSLGLNILFAVFLVLGFLIGLKRGMKRTLVRGVWLAVVVVALIFISTKITGWIMNINFNLTYQGQNCGTLNNYLIALLNAELPIEGFDYSGIINLGLALVNIIVNVIIFIVLYWVLKLITLPLYWIGNAFIFAGERRKKKRAKKEKQKIKIKKYRFAGGLIGIVIALLSFCITMTPIIGYVNIAKSIDKNTVNDEGKGVLSENIGEPYTALINEYDKSVPMKVLSTIKLDSVFNALFNNLTTSKINNTKVSLSEEVQTGTKLYNEIKGLKAPDFKTITQAELDSLLTTVNNAIDITFEMKLISSSWDIVVPFGVKYARTTIDTTNFKPYTLNLYNAVFDEMENFNSVSTKGELKNVVALIKALNDNNLLLPIIQNSEIDAIEHLKLNLTKEASDEIVEKLFAINTVNDLAPAVVNFLLGYGAEKLNYDYSSEESVEAEELKNSASVIVNSVVDLISTYDKNTSTKVALNANTIGVFGGILDELKNVLSEDNFNSVVDAVEPKLNNIANDTLSSQPEFMKTAVNEVISNISEIDSYETTFVELYNAFDELKTQFNGAKVEDNYDVQLMNFNKLGEALDKIQNNGLMKGNLFVDILHDAFEYYIKEFEKQFSSEDNPFEFTFDTVVLNNINGIKSNGVTWETELPKYKNTLGIFVNLFRNNQEVSVVDKLRNESDSSLEDLGVELDSNLKSSTLFNGADRLLVADLLTIADNNFNTEDNADLSTMLNKAKQNVLNESNILTWKHELKHLKSFVTIELNDNSEVGILDIAETIDSVVFDTTVNSETIPASKVFTKPIINEYIASYLNTVFEDIDSDNDFYKTLLKIKNGFLYEGTTESGVTYGAINSYYFEFESLFILQDMTEIVNGDFDFKIDGSVLGRKIDDALAVGVLESDPKIIVNRSLVNDYLKDYITDKVTINGDFSGVITNITGTKSGDNFGTGRIDTMTNSYQVEFNYLAQLMKVSETFGSVAIDTINVPKTIDGVNVTLAECFDGGDNVSDPIRKSQLVGDSLITVFTSVFNDFMTNNTKADDEAYNDILEEIDFNYNDSVYGIKNNIIWSNKTVGYTYTQLINSIVDIDKYVNSGSSNYVASITLDKLNTNASDYESTLETLQDGILMSTNATNRLMKYILTDLYTLIQPLNNTEANAYVLAYLSFLDGTIIESNGASKNVSSKNAYLPYNTTDTLVYAGLKDATANTWSFDIFNNGGLLLNKPFTAIKTYLNGGTE